MQIIYLANTDKEKEQLRSLVARLEDFHDAAHPNRPDFLYDYLQPVCDFESVTVCNRLHSHYYNLLTQRKIAVENGKAVIVPQTEEEITARTQELFNKTAKSNKYVYDFDVSTKNEESILE